MMESNAKKNFNYATRSFAILLNHLKLINSNIFIFFALSAHLNRTAYLIAFNKQCSHFMGVNLARLNTVVQRLGHIECVVTHSLRYSRVYFEIDLFSFSNEFQLRHDRKPINE